MPIPNVNISIQNGGLGQTLQLVDGVFGYLAGVSIAPLSLALNTPVQLFSLKDAEELGLTEAYDSVLYRNLKTFYAEAGNGSRLNLMLYDIAVHLKSGILDKEETLGAVKLLDFDKDISLLFCTGAGATPTVVGIDEDCIAALRVGQILAEQRALENKPIRVIIEGNGFDGIAANLPDLTERSDNRCGIFLGSESLDGRADVGMLAGRLALIPVMRNAGRVVDGNLSISEGFIGNKAVDEFSDGELSVIHDKGYMTIRTFVSRAGYFITDDVMATASTDDYKFLARGRVVDKAQRIAYDTYLNKLNDEVPVTDSGKLPAALATGWEAEIERAIGVSMANEISRVRAVVDVNQNVLSTNKILVQVFIVPVGYAKEIEVQLGFENPLNA